MQTMRLPRRLDEIDLDELHRRLLAGELRLDWSDVEPGISPAFLERLFAGMNQADAIDDIGGDTVPERLMPEIQAAFASVEARAKREAARNDTHSKHEQIAPALWLPENTHDTHPPTVFEERVEDKPESVPDVPQAVDASQSQPAHPLLAAPSPAGMREELEAMVLRDLLGPAGGEDEEVDEDRVRDRYLVGMLAPGKTQTVPEEHDPLADAETGGPDEGAEDEDTAQKASFNPASLGLSFSVDAQTTELLVSAHWGQYRRTESASIKTVHGRPKQIWKRTVRGGDGHLIQLKEGPIPFWQPAEDEQPDVFVRGLVRRSGETWMVSLFLVNGQKEPKRLRDEAWLFQPALIVEAPGGAPIFQQRPSERLHRMTDEEKAMAMLYRHHVSFAMGHGVSVHAETLPDDPTSAVRLSTRVAPTYDVPLTEAPTSIELPSMDGLILDMKLLAESTATDLVAALRPLIIAYDGWIDEQAQCLPDASTPPTSDLAEYRIVASKALVQCRRTLERIRSGITMLANSDEARRAFAFMNRAMWQQRLHTIYAEEQRRNNAITLEELDQPRNRSWRPFQLAFILLNLPALTDLQHPERSTDASALADLLWFPTGGGKTEAYLGLTAYTLAIRRLQGTVAGRSGLDGVAVIMRYTLRLLTLQQFQRASSLICACEVIRRKESTTWGQTPFRLGLWVGQRSTPNTTDDSAEANRQEHGVRGSLFGGIGSPRQLTNCPWCGSAIEGGKNIEVETYGRGKGRTFIYCSDAYGQCPFSKRQSYREGLPVVVVDEEIYRLLPSLLIATVDKFAQLPWKGETQMLFGQVDKYCSRHGFRSADLEDSDTHKKQGNLEAAHSIEHAPLRPPDLIIQDELHLISGPLGSLVGLYETAIDHLATWEVKGKQVRPKVIAATATIRRAEHQIKALFLRDVSVFPPQGLDVEDNFFSRQRQPSEQTPGRRYLGICANGRRLKAALIRIYVAYLSATQVLYDKYGAAADPWMTLVGYFNSMSELGGMRRLIDDDVSSRLWKMDRRGLAKRRKPVVEELTSRKSSSAIPEVLSKLEQTFATEKPRPLDVLLATNMISVGVDVKRLGLMVVTGQPKTTAEYIQATSRVGRAHPGLVCVVYNWSRPRDLSHYEQFEHYHATFYQQVEALSVTPFAPRALDRGLAALLTSYVRLTGTELSPNAQAGEAAVPSADNSFAAAIEDIGRRASEVTDNYEAEERIRADLAKLRDYWLMKASTTPKLGYKQLNDGRTLGLLQEPERGNWQPFTCLNSLRDVEPTVYLVLDERSLGDNDLAATVQTETAEEAGL